MNYDLMDHGRYYDGSSPYDPVWAGGMGGKGARDGIANLPPVKHSEPDEGLINEMKQQEARRQTGWPFPLGGQGFL